MVYDGKAIARAGQLFETRGKSFVTNRIIPWIYGQVVVCISDGKIITRGPLRLSRAHARLPAAESGSAISRAPIREKGKNALVWQRRFGRVTGENASPPRAPARLAMPPAGCKFASCGASLCGCARASVLARPSPVASRCGRQRAPVGCNACRRRRRPAQPSRLLRAAHAMLVSAVVVVASAGLAVEACFSPPAIVQALRLRRKGAEQSERERVRETQHRMGKGEDSDAGGHVVAA